MQRPRPHLDLPNQSQGLCARSGRWRGAAPEHTGDRGYLYQGQADPGSLGALCPQVSPLSRPVLLGLRGCPEQTPASLLLAGLTVRGGGRSRSGFGGGAAYMDRL